MDLSTTSRCFLLARISNSTLGPTCVDNTEQAIVYYFDATVKLFKDLPTFDWLVAAGITPSTTATYTRNEIASALEAAYGFAVGLQCKSRTLQEVYYYHHVGACSLVCPILFG